MNTWVGINLKEKISENRIVNLLLNIFCVPLPMLMNYVVSRPNLSIHAKQSSHHHSQQGR